MYLVLGLIALLPIVLYGLFIYNKDSIKEPKPLLIKLFFGGILATILTLEISIVLELFFPFFANDVEKLEYLNKFIYILFKIALVEEISIWIFTYLISFNSEYFDETFDGIIYCCFTRLGFALFENVLYVCMLTTSISEGLNVGVGRTFVSVPAHICDAIFMGLYFSLAKQNEDRRAWYLILSVLVPVILHVTYDFIIYSNFGNIVLIGYIVIVFVLSLLQLNISAYNNRLFIKNSKRKIKK